MGTRSPHAGVLNKELQQTSESRCSPNALDVADLSRPISQIELTGTPFITPRRARQAFKFLSFFPGDPSWICKECELRYKNFTSAFLHAEESHLPPADKLDIQLPSQETWRFLHQTGAWNTLYSYVHQQEAYMLKRMLDESVLPEEERIAVDVEVAKWCRFLEGIVKEEGRSVKIGVEKLGRMVMRLMETRIMLGRQEYGESLQRIGEQESLAEVLPLLTREYIREEERDAIYHDGVDRDLDKLQILV